MGMSQDIAVLLCPPFGWEEICSYRSRRAWALHLASAGYPAMRIDLPGTGDSGGSPRDPDRVRAWSEAVTESVDQLRERTGCASIAAIGIGLGGLVLWNAICEGAHVDQVALWSVAARGRAFVRELRTFARLEENSEAASTERGEPASGDLFAGGFLLSAQTIAAIEHIDLTQLNPQPGRVRRVLLLDRDGMAADGRLQAHIAAIGAQISLLPGRGYGAMTAKPHHARAPRDVFTALTTWLEADTEVDNAPSRRKQTPVGSSARRAHRIEHSNGVTPAGWETKEIALSDEIIESTVTVQQPFGELFGVLTRPAGTADAGICALLLNAGAIRRVGPNRMWVEAARRWAARGIPTLRLDLESIGDADGEEMRLRDLAALYEDNLVDQVRAALDMLQAQGLGERFVLGGLCSGACWSFHAALQDPRVIAALLLNPRALFWHPSLETERELRRGMLRRSSWRKVLRGEVPMTRLAEVLAKAPRAPLDLTQRAFQRRGIRQASVDQLGLAFDSLRDAGKSLLFLFSGDEPLREELERDGYLKRTSRWPNMRFEQLPGSDHTLRPIAAQRQAHEQLDAAIERLAARLTVT